MKLYYIHSHVKGHAFQAIAKRGDEYDARYIKVNKKNEKLNILNAWLAVSSMNLNSLFFA